ncbi:HTH-type transcriptional activator Btr [termite gut metagenome]|uniref:HTH-type transcriptional activator Btr n=1 Tax=termite gut metagenome TaxID=433724 RepID=A0A5J4QMH6_9ZZZZ
MLKIRKGFIGQRLNVFPFYVVETALNHPLTSDLVVHSMGYFPKAEGHYVDRGHGCNECILIYCTQGEGWYQLNNRLHKVPANHFFVLPMNIPHRYSASDHDPWTIYWAHFKGNKVRYIENLCQGPVPIELDQNSRIDDRITLFDELLNAFNLEITEDVINYVNLGFNYLISSFLYINIFRDVKLRKGLVNKNFFFVSLATHYMSENIEKRLTLKDLSSHFGYSESYFNRVFHKEVHFSPMDYFLHLKIERADQLLLHTNLKINQISLKLGFDDPYYFSRLFKKVKGVSPKVYRKALVEDNE